MKSALKYLRILFFLIMAAGCSILIANYYSLIQNENLIKQIHSLGLPVLIILLPYLFIMLNDTAGWLNCFEKRTFRKMFGKLFLLRVATESLQTSLPGGAAYAECIRPFLLKKHLGYGYTESIAANIITKVNIFIAQVIFLICGILVLSLGYKNNSASDGFINGPELYILAGIFIVLVFVISRLIYKKDLILRVISLIGMIKIKPAQNLYTKVKGPAVSINRTLTSFYRDHKIRLLITAGCFLLTWVLMAFESLIILKVMGVNADLFQMIVLESVASFVRIIFFFLPGAVGPQDVSIIFLFTLTGVPDPVLNSFLFVILKRSKEFFWIITGLILLVYSGIKPKNLIIRERRNLDISVLPH